MIKQFDIIKNLGQFRDWRGDEETAFAEFNLIFAENAKGKTTLTTILRSLAEGNADMLLARRRVGTSSTPLVKISIQTDTNPIVFNQSGWNTTIPTLEIFDEAFIEANVYTGSSIHPSQRSAMHDLINGPRGAVLQDKARLLRSERDKLNEQINDTKTHIRSFSPNITDVDAFVTLKQIDDLENQLKRINAAIDAQKNRALVFQTNLFQPLPLPRLSLESVANLLATGLDQAQGNAGAQVREHIANMRSDAETWIKTGLEHFAHSPSTLQYTCPFCLQHLGASPIFRAYLLYFGNEYNRIERDFREGSEEISRVFGKSTQQMFVILQSTNSQLTAFWKQYNIKIPQDFDTDDVTAIWDSALTRLDALFQLKRQDILNPVFMSDIDESHFRAWNTTVDRIAYYNQIVERANDEIKVLRESIQSSQLQELELERQQLLTVKKRYEEDVAKVCQAYIDLISRHSTISGRLHHCTDKLNAHRNSAFSVYQDEVNNILSTFTRNFSIAGLKHVNRSQDYYCEYQLDILGHEVPLAHRDTEPPAPSFSTTLSAGDRSSLAFAIFLASLNTHDDLSDHILVFDDPLSSQDETRSRETINRIISHIGKVTQIIVLSHRQDFLAKVWLNAKNLTQRDGTEMKALQMKGGNSSRIEDWNVERYSDGERRRIESEFESFVDDRTGDAKTIARNIRPFLEEYFLFNFPTVISSNQTLGEIILSIANPPEGKGIDFSEDMIDDLQKINEYTRNFHHKDFEINEEELCLWVGRTLNFIRKR